MFGRLTRILALAVAAILIVTPAEAQGRFKVLVPDLYALEGADRGFGEDIAEELRDLLEGLPTHQPIDRDEIEDQLDEFDMRMRDLDCLRTRQLATQIEAQIALCAQFSGRKESAEITGIQFWDMTVSEALDVDPITVTGRDSDKVAAQQIFEAFDRMVQLARAQQFCAEYALSQQWDNALRNCEQALDLNPAAIATRARKARIHYEQAQEESNEAAKQEYLRQSLESLGAVLDGNEFHEEALQLAGVVSIQMNNEEQGRLYFGRYLEVNPGADQIRLNIAYDMSQAGDPEGAMALIQQGLDGAPENADLLTYYATYAFAAANKRAGETQTDAEMSPQAKSLYRETIATLNKIAAIQGAETPLATWRTVIASHLQLGENAEAEAVARRTLESTADDTFVLSFLADALQRQGRIDEAVATLTRVEGLAPETPNLQIKQANWLMLDGRLNDAIVYLRKAVELEQASTDEVALMIFGDAVNKGVRAENWTYALRGLLAAKQFRVTSANRAQFDFWHGWTIYHQAMEAQQPQDLASAQRAMPMFEQARDLFNAGRPFARQSGMNLQQILDAVNQYIEIQTVIIRRFG